MAAEHGASLRAEVRRLRRQQHELIARFDALLGADSEVAARVFPLVRSLNQHRGLDARNGFHSHFHGVAIAKASVCVEERRQLRWVKKEGDIARHAPFQTASSGQCNDMDGAGSSHVDPWYYLEGMLNGDTGMVCGASIAFSGSAGLPWEGVSLHAATLHNRACHDALLMQTKMLFSESSNFVYTETASSFVVSDPAGLSDTSALVDSQHFFVGDCGGQGGTLGASRRLAALSSVEEDLVVDGNHVLVAYTVEPKTGCDYLASASRLAAGASWLSDDALVCTDPGCGKLKIAYPSMLFGGSFIDGHSLLCSVLSLNHGLGGVVNGNILDVYFPPDLLRLLDGSDNGVLDMWRFLGRSVAGGMVLRLPSLGTSSPCWLGDNLLTAWWGRSFTQSFGVLLDVAAAYSDSYYASFRLRLGSRAATTAALIPVAIIILALQQPLFAACSAHLRFWPLLRGAFL